MSCYEELRRLEDEGIDLIEVLGQDRPLGSPEDLQELIRRLQHCTENLYGELLYFLTHRRFSAERAKDLWDEILAHKEQMVELLGRTVDFRVAALDYLSSESVLRGVRLIAKPEFESIQSYVNIDQVTSVYNRRYFQEVLRVEFQRSRRYESPMSLLIVDVDDFKAINDDYGHPEGDVILRKVGRLLKDNTRQADSVCRYGGDEFAIVLPQTDTPDAQAFAERIRRAMFTVSLDGVADGNGGPAALWSASLQNAVSGRSVAAGSPPGSENGSHVTLSIGGATYPGHCDELEELIVLADQACYRAKEEGKDRVCICEGPTNWSLGE